jgi:hypothetical protein
MDFNINLLVFAGVSFGASTIIFFLWNNFAKKSPLICDKNTSTCICKAQYCGYCGVKLCKCNFKTVDKCTCKEAIDSKTSKFSKIKNFFSSTIHLPRFSVQRFPLFCLILQPIFTRISLAFKNMRITEQKKAEASLYKLAKILWDQGKYSEAEQINSQMLNVRRIATVALIRTNK